MHNHLYDSRLYCKRLIKLFIRTESLKSSYLCVAVNGGDKVLSSKSSISMLLQIQGLLHLTSPQLKGKLQFQHSNIGVSSTKLERKVCKTKLIFLYFILCIQV